MWAVERVTSSGASEPAEGTCGWNVAQPLHTTARVARQKHFSKLFSHVLTWGKIRHSTLQLHISSGIRRLQQRVAPNASFRCHDALNLIYNLLMHLSDLGHKHYIQTCLATQSHVGTTRLKHALHLAQLQPQHGGLLRHSDTATLSTVQLASSTGPG